MVRSSENQQTAAVAELILAMLRLLESQTNFGYF
jgi:hypothetical protein